MICKKLGSWQAVWLGFLLTACASAPSSASLSTAASSEPAAYSARTRGNTSPDARVAGFTGFYIEVRGFISKEGIDTYDFPVISSIVAGSPAALAGLGLGDVILKANGKDTRIIGALFPEVNVRMTLRVRRGTTEIETSLVPIAHRRVSEIPR